MIKRIVFFLVLLPALSFPQAVERFPKPDFESGYVRPELQTPVPRSLTLEILDIVLFVAVLSLASWIALRQRSRRAMFGLMLFSIAYFGFFREGCVCSVGAIQNVAYSLFDSGYAIPVSVLIFFGLPLLFALFFGRTFCAAVCPLGGLQDVVILKPVKVPRWIEQPLSLLAYIYLGLAILFAATGAGFIICRYDPFIGFYRFGASSNMILLGAFMLLLGTVVARPYCRFLCPYGVLLNWMSRLSKKHVTITPDRCSECRLCEASCPFDAINPSSTGRVVTGKKREIRRLLWLVLLLPVVLFVSGWAVSKLHPVLARQHPSVVLAEAITLEDSGLRLESSESTDAFRASGRPIQDLLVEARQIQNRFRIGGWWLGVFLGLVFGMKLIQLTRQHRQEEYLPDRGRCLSCARCFLYCPYEQVRLGHITPEEVP